ncbi:hypothetical protein DICSQDRAFT_163857 [Dichomitus squalens LYAD-421 SS1]|uniref:DUF6534 domain-containing protein n=1 Tax=Dichomitus squalens (strain LYAD-421) TaxID=732165 RepID=R7SNC8_DICSQ|nr:uncharacterized protein DICSQDRAFT_163857 [Dichomitus squalens LYAD-421 SS1]EJF56507.1 hypothetical protein DICSQDRAFT_163857 [Dichomitus squalens LYAD-421 SS1]
MNTTDPAAPATSGPSPLVLPQLPSLANTYGAIFIGNCVALMLYGLTTYQTYRYFRLYPKDSIFLKGLVAVIFYYHLIKNYFNPQTLADDTWSLRLTAPMQVVLLLAETGFMTKLSMEAYQGHQEQDFTGFTWIVSAAFGLAVAVDSILAGTLIAYLLGGRTGNRRTDDMIQTLIVYTINTGLVTSVAGLFTFVFALIMPRNMIYIAVGLVATKLYACSVLALLNSRRYLSSSLVDTLNTQSMQFNNDTGCVHCSAIQRRTAPEPVAVSLPDHGDADTSGNGSQSQVEEMRFRGGDLESAAGLEAEKKMTVDSV